MKKKEYTDKEIEEIISNTSSMYSGLDACGYPDTAEKVSEAANVMKYLFNKIKEIRKVLNDKS